MCTVIVYMYKYIHTHAHACTCTCIQPTCISLCVHLYTDRDRKMTYACKLCSCSNSTDHAVVVIHANRFKTRRQARRPHVRACAYAWVSAQGAYGFPNPSFTCGIRLSVKVDLHVSCVFIHTKYPRHTLRILSVSA